MRDRFDDIMDELDDLDAAYRKRGFFTKEEKDHWIALCYELDGIAAAELGDDYYADMEDEVDDDSEEE